MNEERAKFNANLSIRLNAKEASLGINEQKTQVRQKPAMTQRRPERVYSATVTRAILFLAGIILRLSLRSTTLVEAQSTSHSSNRSPMDDIDRDTFQFPACDIYPRTEMVSCEGRFFSESCTCPKNTILSAFDSFLVTAMM